MAIDTASYNALQHASLALHDLRRARRNFSQDHPSFDAYLAARIATENLVQSLSANLSVPTSHTENED